MSSPALQLRERLPRLAEDAVARARLSVVPRRRTRAARMPFVTLVSLVLLGGVVGLLCFNTQMQQASFAATALQDQSTNLAAREQTLRDELQVLRSPQHLADQAQSVGLVVPESACTLRLAQATTSGDCVAATDASTPRLEARPPRKPAVLDPAPNVILVAPPVAPPAAEAQATGRGEGRGEGRRDQQQRDTDRG